MKYEVCFTYFFHVFVWNLPFRTKYIRTGKVISSQDNTPLIGVNVMLSGESTVLLPI
jgi:hypothetical protein